MHCPVKPKLAEGLEIFSNPPNIANNETQNILNGGNLISKIRNWK